MKKIVGRGLQGRPPTKEETRAPILETLQRVGIVSGVVSGAKSA